MLKDRKRLVEGRGEDRRRRAQMILEYAAFLRSLFSIANWFVTITFRNRYQDSKADFDEEHERAKKEFKEEFKKRIRPGGGITKLAADPRIAAWEPDSKNRHEPGPPVRDAALREIEHWLLELGWEAAGRTRQEIFDWLADGLSGTERFDYAKRQSGKCLCCALLNNPVMLSFYVEVRMVATRAIGWVIAEEFGRIGGRWHVHILIRGANHLRRKKWWRRAFTRFGRTRIEPIHD